MRSREVSIPESTASLNELVEMNKEHPERIKAMIPRFVDYAVWRQEDKGEGHLEVALFPRPFVKAQDVTLKTTLSDLVARRGPAWECGKVSRCFVGDSHLG